MDDREFYFSFQQKTPPFLYIQGLEVLFKYFKLHSVKKSYLIGIQISEYKSGLNGSSSV